MVHHIIGYLHTRRVRENYDRILISNFELTLFYVAKTLRDRLHRRF